MNRYQDNYGVIDSKIYNKIHQQVILIVGLGGLGGYLANGFARLGVKKIILVDHDRFETKNLNRQLFSTSENLKRFKVSIVKEAIDSINPNVEVTAIEHQVQSIEDHHFIGVDWIVDAVDDIETKCYLEALCHRFNKPLLHGAIGGWFGQIGIIESHRRILKQLYERKQNGAEMSQKSPTFIPGVVAHMMLAEWVKYHINKHNSLTNSILFIDLFHHKYQTMHFETEVF